MASSGALNNHSYDIMVRPHVLPHQARKEMIVVSGHFPKQSVCCAEALLTRSPRTEWPQLRPAPLGKGTHLFCQKEAFLEWSAFCRRHPSCIR